MKKYNIVKETSKTVAILLILFSLLLLFWQHNLPLSEYSVKDHNQKIALKLYQEAYSGLVDKVDFVSEKSKRKVIFLKNKDWVSPMGQYHNLHRIAVGDSIAKESNSFVIKVYPKNSPDSLVILQHNSVIMKSLKGSH